MHRFFILSLFSLVSVASFGQDLPNNLTVTNQLNAISIYGVNSVVVKNDATEVDHLGDDLFIHADALLHFNLLVEGNICGAQFHSVSIQTKDVAEQTHISLHYIRAINPNVDVLIGCAAYSAPRTITVAMRLYGFAQNTFEKTYALAKGWNGQDGQVLVKVRYEVGVGLVATVAP